MTDQYIAITTEILSEIKSNDIGDRDLVSGLTHREIMVLVAAQAITKIAEIDDGAAE